MKHKLYIQQTIAVLMTAIICFGCKNNMNEIDALFDDTNKAEEVSTNLHLYISQNGVVSHDFYTPMLKTYKNPEPYNECPQGMKIISYTNKKKNSELTAKYGVNYEDRKIMEAKNNVVITNFNTGEIIETEHLIWDVEKKLVYSNTQIKQTKPDGSIYLGDRFESDESLSKYTIYNAKLVFYDKDE